MRTHLRSHWDETLGRPFDRHATPDERTRRDAARKKRNRSKPRRQAFRSIANREPGPHVEKLATPEEDTIETTDRSGAAGRARSTCARAAGRAVPRP